MLVRRMSSRLSSPFGRRSTEPHPAQAAERATRAAARDAERAAEEQFSIGAPHTLANYVTPALVLHERVRQPVLVSAPYGHGDRASDLFTLLGNGGRRYLREMSVFMSALQSNGFVLERAHLVTFHSWWVVTGRFMRYYLAVADKAWETTRRDYEAHSRHTLRFFEANQGRPTALGPADRPLRDPARLAIEPAPGGATLAIEAPPPMMAV
eukprot:contig_1840_g296